MDPQHRCLHADTTHLALEGPVEAFALDQRDVRRRAPHVETDRPIEAGGPRDPAGRDDPARRSREQRVGAAEALAFGEPPRRLHVAELGLGQTAREGVHVPAQQRRQVAVRDRRLAAREEPDLPRELVGTDDVIEPDVTGHLGERTLVRGVEMGVQPDDRDGPGPLVAGAFEERACVVEVDGLDDLAVGAAASGDFEPPALKAGGARDLESEEVGAFLGADVEDAGESFVREERRRDAAAFEERVRRDGRAELDACTPGRVGARAGEGDDPFHRLEGRAIRREHLRRMDGAVRGEAEAIGEGPAAVDPELPRASAHSASDRDARRSRESTASIPARRASSPKRRIPTRATMP